MHYAYVFMSRMGSRWIYLVFASVLHLVVNSVYFKGHLNIVQILLFQHFQPIKVGKSN